MAEGSAPGIIYPGFPTRAPLPATGTPTTHVQFATINPSNGEVLRRYPEHTGEQIERALAAAHEAQRSWRLRSVSERAPVFKETARLLRERQRSLGELISMEMGKPFKEALAEVEKSAWGAEYYAEHAEDFLKDRTLEVGDRKAYVTLQPLGLVLAIMPWNFPVWQAIRAAVPALAAGNGVVLKHAPNVPGCALAVKDVLDAAGLPKDLLANLFIDVETTGSLVRDGRVQAVTLTGSTEAGKAVGQLAGSEVKTCVLELGGSDPYVVLEDADVALAVEACVTSRLINSGQSCIAAKRMIVHESVAKEFTEQVVSRMGAVRVGDPMAELTDVGPLARQDLRDRLADQVDRSVEAGARCLLGGDVPDNPGWYYPSTVLTDVRPGMPAWEEELFGPVSVIITVDSEEEALQVANDTPYGLGAAVFTSDATRGERIARTGLEAGSCFVNGFVHSDPRLPFGGVKASGFGRELSEYGIQEFVNVKTIVVEA